MKKPCPQLLFGTVSQCHNKDPTQPVYALIINHEIAKIERSLQQFVHIVFPCDFLCKRTGKFIYNADFHQKLLDIGIPLVYNIIFQIGNKGLFNPFYHFPSRRHLIFADKLESEHNSICIPLCIIEKLLS